MKNWQAGKEDFVYDAIFLSFLQFMMSGVVFMARAAQRRPDRRREIAEALNQCISEQGYANTTLKDLADRAGLSPSHVGYYFDNKAAALRYYAELICEQNLVALPDLGARDLDGLLDELADFCLGPGRTSTRLLGVNLELAGLAVHDPALHEIKARHTEVWRAYLERLFRRAPPAGDVSPREAAYLAHALLVGLHTNTLFDSELERGQALNLLRRTLRQLTGLPLPHGTRAPRRNEPIPRKKRRR